ncbi:MAG: 23S rRNA (uracil(1939)-C(5))-methyltransferase RlmD, partial [Muribaculaceae bacterium]|nr:23S rRNA (uracil(1939)-C(5))-methyltransferase RlmD [Muribaculaceae bacterium]
IPGAFDMVLDINYCHLQDAGIGNELRNFVKQFGKDNDLSFYDLRANEGLLRTLMIRTASTGEVMALMSFGEDNPEAINKVMEAIAERFGDRITSLLYVINLKANDTFGDLEVHTYRGLPFITEEMEGLKFRVGPKSFYQTNSAQALRLYSVTREMADLKGDELVYDLYTGTGTIANFVARRARQVVGIEYVPEAIEDAKVNSEINGINNTLFYAGDMKDVLNDEFIAEHGRPDVMIVDPPRAGMHQDVVDVILRAEPQRIVYVSCNPATQARDLQLLAAKYRITAVQPVDMFPHTAHIENVVRLDRI